MRTSTSIRCSAWLGESCCPWVYGPHGGLPMFFFEKKWTQNHQTMVTLVILFQRNTNGFGCFTPFYETPISLTYHWFRQFFCLCLDCEDGLKSSGDACDSRRSIFNNIFQQTKCKAKYVGWNQSRSTLFLELIKLTPLPCFCSQMLPWHHFCLQSKVRKVQKV
jgi:hypothetical protein